MIAFIEDQRVVYGGDSICRVLPIAPSIARQAIAEQSAARGHITTAWRDSLTRSTLRNTINACSATARNQAGLG
mgnify:CR=1 FL=1|tara:strand:+ start:361 stop:582 length:222 start_codon:yes stop_codon:yes gene_type:complete